MLRISTAKLVFLTYAFALAFLCPACCSQAIYRVEGQSYPDNYDYHNCSCIGTTVTAIQEPTPDTCTQDYQCPQPTHCDDGVCTLCKRVTVTCFAEDANRPFKCCPGNKCQNLQNTDTFMCLRADNHCVSDLQCPQPYKCVSRVSKCGLCLKENERCSIINTIGTENECCNGFCDISVNPGESWGVCRRPMLGRCTNNTQCSHNFECHGGQCVMCLKSDARCFQDDECCTGRCRKPRNLSYNTCV